MSREGVERENREIGKVILKGGHEQRVGRVQIVISNSKRAEREGGEIWQK
jgi:hypothetical protein